MGEREKQSEFSRKLEAATTAIDAHSRYIASRYGTETEAGSELSLWKPYHVKEREEVLQIVSTLFNTAIARKNDMSTRNMLANLRQEDLPALLMAASFFYPSFDDLYAVDASLAKEKMEAAGVFTPRDFAIVSAALEGSVVRDSHDASIRESSLDPQSDFSTHGWLLSDSFKIFIKGHQQSMYMIPLLGIERLVESNAIKTKNNRLPKNLDEVVADGTTYSHDVLRNDIRRIDRDLFSTESTFNPRLPITTQKFPYFASNREYFYNTIVPQSEKNIDLSTMLRNTQKFALDLRGMGT